MNIYELFKNKNSISNICPPTDFSQFLSLGFGSFAVSIEKVTFFEKKAKKYKFLNSVENEKKNNFGKKIFYEVLISIGRINVQKISQIGDGHLVDSYKKPLLKCYSIVSILEYTPHLF
jgi:hypothetical protein